MMVPGAKLAESGFRKWSTKYCKVTNIHDT